MLMNCSLIIRTFNEEKHIAKLLVGIIEQSVNDLEIILVDSGSTDATISIASKFPINILHIDPSSFSFGQSLNLGCSAARGEYLVFASAHVYPVFNDWLLYILKPFKDTKVALVYGKQRGGTTTEFSEHRIFSQWYPDDSVDNQQTPFCNNANAAIRKSVWEEIKYNNDLTGLEDIEWAKRAQALGYSISYVADAEVIHIHEETSFQIFNRYKREGIAYSFIFSDQTFSFFDLIKLWTVNTISDYIYALKKRRFMKNIVSIPLFRLLQFSGTYRGFKQRSSITNALKNRLYYPDGFFTLKASDPPSAKRQPIEYDNIIDLEKYEEDI